jgi:hypothetical protein
MFKPEDQKLKEDLAKQREIMMDRMSRLKALRDNPVSGWKDFLAIIDNYIAYCNKRKITTKLDTATPALLEQLRFMDNYVSALEWVKQIPSQYAKETEDKLARIKQSEEQPDPEFV